MYALIPDFTHKSTSVTLFTKIYPNLVAKQGKRDSEINMDRQRQKQQETLP